MVPRARFSQERKSYSKLYIKNFDISSHVLKKSKPGKDVR